MGAQADLQLFMVEHDLRGLSPEQLANAYRALGEAVRREARRGGQIRYVQRVVASAERKGLCLFEAPEPSLVRRVHDTAQFPLARILAVTSSPPPGSGPTADFEEGTLPMTDVDTRTRATGTPPLNTLARAAAAVLLALVAPAVSFLPALTTNVHGSGAAVTFPHGYAVMLVVTIVVTAIACALGAMIAGRAGLVAIPIGLAVWALIGFVLIVAGLSLGHHAHLTEWGIALLAAALAGAAVGLPLAARR